MKKTAMPLVLGVTFLMAGCVPSLNPLYTEKDVVFEPKLVGIWAESDNDNETWTFEKAGEKQYKAIYKEDKGTGEFLVHLVKLGETLFLDFYPDSDALNELKRNDFYKSHLLQAHTFAKIDQIEPTLKMAFMDPDWLKKLLEKTPKAIQHETLADEKIVITDSTLELQKFIRKHAKEAFGSDPSNLKRIKSRP